MAGVAAVQVFGTVAPQVYEDSKSFSCNFNGVSQSRDDFVKSTIGHWRMVHPELNVCVLNNKWPHNVSINDGVKLHVEIPKHIWGTHGFDIYIFKSGVITRMGDGGWINWGFAGKYEQNDCHVTFYEP